jgi:hypothetical protein
MAEISCGINYLMNGGCCMSLTMQRMQWAGVSTRPELLILLLSEQTPHCLPLSKP